jgi:glycosyltransferase involved in cell wall biosynthesis
MGDKVNRMIAEADGEYVVCVDDDDYLAPDYMSVVLPNLDGDFLGYRILVLDRGAYQGEVEHRGEIAGWGDWSPRGVTPKCPIRRSLAAQVPFGNEYSADARWSRQVGQLVASSSYVDRVLYVYDVWNSLGTEPNQRPWQWESQRDIGQWPFGSEKIRWL